MEEGKTERCVLHCKDTKLKAIHNFTITLQVQMKLCFTLQRYKIESNSQRGANLLTHKLCCVLHCKDTKLKAIHNSQPLTKRYVHVVFYTAKIQN